MSMRDDLDQWCPNCDRETVTIGIGDYPRRCPVCGYTEQRVERLVDQIESRSL